MTIIHGIIACRLQNVGSKSEGVTPFLVGDDGKTYKLYRAGILPLSDPFFPLYDGMQVGVSGNVEEATGNLCVSSLLLEDGTEVIPPVVEPLVIDKPIDFTLLPEEKKTLKKKK